MRGGGLASFRDGRFTPHKGRSARSCARCAKTRDGAIWVGTDTGLSRIDAAGTRTYTTRDGLSLDVVFAIHEDRDGVLWIGTYGGGLNRFEHGRFTRYTTKNGLFDDIAYQVLEDREGSLWIPCNKGLMRLSKRELNLVAAGRQADVHTKVYARDGRPAGLGVQRQLAAGRLGRARRPALVPVDQGRHRRRPVGARGRTRCRRRSCSSRSASTGSWCRAAAPSPPGRAPASSSSATPRCRSPRRPGSASSTASTASTSTGATPAIGEPPTTRTFRRAGTRSASMAANADGVWSAQPATAAIVLRPHFYQATWFHLATVATIGLVAAIWIRGRRRLVQARERALTALVDERTHELRAQVGERLQAEAVGAGQRITLSRAVRRRARRLSRARHRRPAGARELDRAAPARSRRRRDDRPRRAGSSTPSRTRRGAPSAGCCTGRLRPAPTERTLRRHDGSLIPVLVDSRLVRDDRGAITGLRVTVQDISIRKRIEEALDRERQQLLSIIADAPVSMAMFDRDLRYLAHSRKWVDDMGWPGVSLVGRLHYEVVPDIPDQFREAHRRALAGEIITCPEDAFERGDGSVTWLRWAVHPWHARRRIDRRHRAGHRHHQRAGARRARRRSRRRASSPSSSPTSATRSARR